VALFDNTVAQLVIEVDFPVLEIILEMDIVNAGANAIGKGGEGQIMGCDQADRATLQQSFHHAKGTDFAVMGIGAVQDLIEQEEHRRRAVSKIEDSAQASDLRVEMRDVGLKRVSDADGCSELQVRAALQSHRQLRSRFLQPFHSVASSDRAQRQAASCT